MSGEAEQRRTRRAVFFDRDGTLMEEVEYCREPAKVRAFPGVKEALETLHTRGFLNIIISNQSGIGRGWITQAEYDAVHAALLTQIGAENIDATYVCPDVPGQRSTRRKPEPGMLFEAADDLEIDLEQSYFVGDKDADIEAGRRAGVRTVLVKTGYGSRHLDCGADLIAEDAADAVHKILKAEAE